MTNKDVLDTEVQNLRALYDKVWNLFLAFLGGIGVVFMTAYTSTKLKSLYVVVIILMFFALGFISWLIKIWSDLSKKPKELKDV